MNCLKPVLPMYAFHSAENQQVIRLLDTLHQAAKADAPKVLKALGIGIFKKIEPHDVKTAYLPISKEQGNYMYDLIVQNHFKTIVEFGTSFGISTLYLAAAARQTGGKVVTTEIVPEKCEQAHQHFAKAGLYSYIELRQGDALQTLKDWDEPIDFLLLDGWKDLYLPVFQLLEKHIHTKTNIFVDNTNFRGVKQFLKHLQQSKRYIVRPVEVDKGNSVLVTKI